MYIPKNQQAADERVVDDCIPKTIRKYVNETDIHISTQRSSDNIILQFIRHITTHIKNQNIQQTTTQTSKC